MPDICLNEKIFLSANQKINFVVCKVSCLFFNIQLEELTTVCRSVLINQLELSKKMETFFEMVRCRDCIKMMYKVCIKVCDGTVLYLIIRSEN